MTNAPVDDLEFGLRRLFVGVAGGEIVFQFGEVCTIEVIAELVEFGHYVDIRHRVFMTGKFTQCENVILAEHSRHDYS